MVATPSGIPLSDEISPDSDKEEDELCSCLQLANGVTSAGGAAMLANLRIIFALLPQSCF